MRGLLLVAVLAACRGSAPAATDPGALPDCPVDACDGACTNLDVDPLNCGACGTTCVVPNADPICVDAECALGSCIVGWEDCDGDPANGCEAETLCIDGAACPTACGSLGSQDCTDPCAPVCVLPDEVCNLADEDCDGTCDEDLEGCRSAIYRAESLRGAVYGRDAAADAALQIRVDNERYFDVMSIEAPGTRPLYRCALADGTRMLSVQADCAGKAEAPELTLGFVGTTEACEGTELFGLFSPANADYLYTISTRERDRAVDDGYVLEGTLGYVWRAPR